MHSPAHPGALIRETIEGIRSETGQNLPLEEVAKALLTSRKNLSALLNGRARVSPEMAIKLSIAFQNTTAEFWLGLQEDYDLAIARKTVITSEVGVLWKAA